MNNKLLKFLYHFDAKLNEDDAAPTTFAILKMDRKLREQADLFYSSSVTKYIKAGVWPRAAYKAKLDDFGGTVSEVEETKNLQNKQILLTKSLELTEKNATPEEERTVQDLEEIAKLQAEIEELQEKILFFETQQFSIYENTAEAKARNKTIIWLLLHLSYKKISDDKYEPIFKGNDVESKLDEYEEYQENPNWVKIFTRLNYLITLWFIGKIETEEDFKEYDKVGLE